MAEYVARFRSCSEETSATCGLQEALVIFYGKGSMSGRHPLPIKIWFRSLEYNSIQPLTIVSSSLPKKINK